LETFDRVRLFYNEIGRAHVWTPVTSLGP
jgi:hypothetical protein